MAEGGYEEFDNPVFDDDDYEDTAEVAPDVLSVDAPVQVDMRTTESMRSELVRSAVDNYYRYFHQKKALAPSIGKDYSKFEVSRDDGSLRLKQFRTIPLTNKRSGTPLALSTIAAHRGGAAAVREGLGFADWRKRGSISHAAATKLQEVSSNLPSVDDVPLQDLSHVADKAETLVKTLLSDEELNNVLSTIDDPHLDTSGLASSIRELRGLDKALQTIRGEAVNNLAKLTELDEHIAREQNKLKLTDDEPQTKRITDRLRALEDERSARLEAASASREALRTQVSRIRETINRVLNEDTTLAERLRTLFREQGVTIASILTALGFIVSTVVLAFTGGAPASGTGPVPPTPKESGAKEWLRKNT